MQSMIQLLKHFLSHWPVSNPDCFQISTPRAILAHVIMEVMNTLMKQKGFARKERCRHSDYEKTNGV